jgi:hypothetical protein
VDFEQEPSQAELSRLLIAADTGVDPHRLVRLCCEHSAGGAISVSLLIPAVEDEPEPGAASGGGADALTRSIALLHAAGIRVAHVVAVGGDGRGVGRLVRSGDFDALLVCEGSTGDASPVLPLAARLAHFHGLTVLRSERPPARPSWLRRAMDSVLRWAPPT